MINHCILLIVILAMHFFIPVGWLVSAATTRSGVDVGLRFIFLLVAPLILGVAHGIGGASEVTAFDCLTNACITGVGFCVPDAVWCVLALAAWLLRKNTGLCGAAARACLNQRRRHLLMPLRALAYTAFSAVICCLLGELAGLYNEFIIVLMCCAPVVLLPEGLRLVRTQRKARS